MELKKTVEQNSYSVKIQALEGGQVMGWAFLVVTTSDRHKEPWGMLENVYVELEHRGQGVGKALVLSAIEEAKSRGCYKLICTSRDSKPEVHTMYEKLGFQKWGVEFRMDLAESPSLQRD